MQVVLSAHDRGLISAWKKGSDFVLYYCFQHGIFVERKGETTGMCYCGEHCKEYVDK